MPCEEYLESIPENKQRISFQILILVETSASLVVTSALLVVLLRFSLRILLRFSKQAQSAGWRFEFWDDQTSAPDAIGWHFMASRNGSAGRRLMAEKCYSQSKAGGGKLLGTSATLLVTGALLVVTRNY